MSCGSRRYVKTASLCVLRRPGYALPRVYAPKSLACDESAMRRPALGGHVLRLASGGFDGQAWFQRMMALLSLEA